jgi:hypothetical protein
LSFTQVEKFLGVLLVNYGKELEFMWIVVFCNGSATMPNESFKQIKQLLLRHCLQFGMQLWQFTLMIIISKKKKELETSLLILRILVF